MKKLPRTSRRHLRVCFEFRILRLVLVSIPVLCQSAVGQLTSVAAQSDPPGLTNAPAMTQAEFAKSIRPLLKQFCFECHAGKRIEGEFDLDSFQHIRQLKFFRTNG